MSPLNNDIIILVWLAINTLLCGFALAFPRRYTEEKPISKCSSSSPPAAKEFLVPSGGRFIIKKKLAPKAWDDRAAYLKEQKDNSRG